MSEKIAVNVVTQEQWDDVSKRLGYVWSIAVWEDCYEESCILLNKKAKGDKEDCSGMGYKIISYEEFISNRIDSIEDIERLWKEGRLDKISYGGGVYGIRNITVSNNIIDLGSVEIHMGIIRFNNVDIEETQKLIKKEKREMRLAHEVNIGDKIKIISAGNGATGCNREIGIVTQETSNNGMLKEDDGVNVKISDIFIWRISANAKVELIQKGDKIMTYKLNDYSWLSNSNCDEISGIELFGNPRDSSARFELLNSNFKSLSIYCGVFNKTIELDARIRNLDNGEVYYTKKKYLIKEESPLQLKLEELEAKSLKISKEQQEITEEIARVRGEM